MVMKGRPSDLLKDIKEMMDFENGGDNDLVAMLADHVNGEDKLKKLIDKKNETVNLFILDCIIFGTAPQGLADYLFEDPTRVPDAGTYLLVSSLENGFAKKVASNSHLSNVVMEKIKSLLDRDMAMEIQQMLCVAEGTSEDTIEKLKESSDPKVASLAAFRKAKENGTPPPKMSSTNKEDFSWEDIMKKNAEIKERMKDMRSKSNKSVHKQYNLDKKK